MLHRFSKSVMYKAVGWNSEKNKQWSIVCHFQTKRQSKQTRKNASNDELQFGEVNFSVYGCLNDYVTTIAKLV